MDTPKRRLRVPKTAEVLADQLREAITTGELREGDALPAERQLMAETGLGRGTVREALRLLEVDGLVSIRPGRGGGVIVHKPSRDAIRRALASVLRFERVSLHDVIEARMLIETAAARLAAERGDAKSIDEIRAALKALEASGSDLPAFAEPGLDFDELVVKAAGNPVLTVVAALIRELILATVAGLPWTEADRSAIVQAHTAILAAIEQGNAEAAGHLVQRHVAAFARQCQVHGGDLHSKKIMKLGTPSTVLSLTTYRTSAPIES